VDKMAYTLPRSLYNILEEALGSKEKAEKFAEAFEKAVEEIDKKAAYKLLNALKIGDVNQFMDVMMRVHMAYDLEVPSLLIKALQWINIVKQS